MQISKNWFIRFEPNFQTLLLRKYKIKKEDVFEIENTILKNLISLGVIINE
ncbi:hypothetical protein ABID29_000112 [Streptococcus rupicaprae]|uniref:Uncharacterized protein n=1 Tax=Streptococcus rupicaprae TaxID=759619 RepID=A0ABV2FEL3_9STRE